MDTSDFVEAGKKLEMPEKVNYRPSIPELEALAGAATVRNEIFGTLPTETGCCRV